MRGLAVFFLAFFLGIGASHADYIRFDFSETETSIPEVIYHDYGTEKVHLVNVSTAYNSKNHEYLVSWDECPQYGMRCQAVAIRVAGTTGAAIGGKFLLEASSPTDGFKIPKIAYDSINNRYLVMWMTHLGDTVTLVGQFIDGQSGNKVGDVFFIGNYAGTDRRVTRIQVHNPLLLYNEHLQEFLAAWDIRIINSNSLAYEPEIYAVKISPAGIPGTVTRVSKVGPEGNLDYVATDAAVAYSPLSNKYLFAWTSIRPGSYYGAISRRQLQANALSGSSLTRLHTDDIEIVPYEEGSSGDPSPMENAALTYNSVNGEFLLTRDGPGSPIKADRLSDGLAHLGGVIVTAPSKDSKDYYSRPNSDYAVKFRPSKNEYVILFQASEPPANIGLQKNNSFLYGQVLSGDDASLRGVKNFRISEGSTNHPMGPDLSIDQFGNVFAAYFANLDAVGANVRGQNESILGKIFSPYELDRPFDYPQSAGPKGGGGTLKARVSKTKGGDGFKMFLASCGGDAADVTLKVYTSQNSTLEIAKDKMLKTKKLQSKKTLKVKVKEQRKMPKYLIITCSNGSPSVSAAKIKIK